MGRRGGVGVRRRRHEHAPRDVATVGRGSIGVGGRRRVPPPGGHIVQGRGCVIAALVDPDEALVFVGEVAIPVDVHRHELDPHLWVVDVGPQCPTREREARRRRVAIKRRQAGRRGQVDPSHILLIALLEGPVGH